MMSDQQVCWRLALELYRVKGASGISKPLAFSEAIAIAGPEDEIDLDQNSGFQLVFPPSLKRAIEIKVIQRSLIEAIGAEIPVWPVEEGGSVEAIDSFLYSKFQPYYEAIAAIFEMDARKRWGMTQYRLDCDRLDQRARHGFFICNEPVLVGDTYRLGLSGIDALLGYSYKEGEEAPPPQETGAPSTGSAELDVLAETLLIFKRNGPKLIEDYTLEQLSKICVQASQRLKQAQDMQENKGEGYSA
ncbi:MAG TPA: hypothetical protein V6C65_27530, partial [Allocoleopsis sp.]